MYEIVDPNELWIHMSFVNSNRSKFAIDYEKVWHSGLSASFSIDTQFKLGSLYGLLMQFFLISRCFAAHY